MRVKFICRSADDFEVRLVGNHDELGERNPDRAIPMALDTAESGHHQWEKYIDLPPGTAVEFKYVKLMRNGFRWERDPNRTFRFDGNTKTCEGDFQEPS